VTVVEGEIVGRDVARRVEVALAEGVLHYKIHVVDLPNGGRIDGMGREDALALARRLGTRAYQARATLAIQSGLVVVEPIERIL
jgi:hypothetical protein